MVFRAAHGVAEDDTRPTGPRQQAAADRRAQVDLNKRVNQAIDTSYRTAWTPIAEQVGLTPGADPHWPILAENLAALSRAGADAPTLLRRRRRRGASYPTSTRPPPSGGGSPGTPPPPSSPPTPPPGRRTRCARRGCRSWPPPSTAPDRRAGATAALMQDPHWPAVITAITRASEHGIPTADLFRYPSAPTATPSPRTPWPTP